MTDLFEQADQPRIQYTPPEPRYRPLVAFSDKHTKQCPGCGLGRNRRSPLCWACTVKARRSPHDPTLYSIDGEPCRKISLTQGQYMDVDATAFDELSRWDWSADWSPLTRSWYAHTAVKLAGKWVILRVHHILFGLNTSVQRDHENHDTLDNRASNLRPCDPNQQMSNRRKRKDNTSGFIGVHWRKKSRRWQATLAYKGKKKSLGHFDSARAAAIVRDQEAIRVHGEFAVLNFPLTDSSLDSRP